MGCYSLKDRVVVITGASKGIGKELAIQYAGKGAKVAMGARSQDKLQALSQEIVNKGGESLWVKTDVAQKEEMDNLVQKATEHFGRVDIIVLNAGIGVIGDFHSLSLEDWKLQFDVNFWGVLYGIYAVLPQMMERKSGQIIIINSLNGKLPLPLCSPYCTTKHALTALTDSIRPELKRHGIHVMGVYPGFVKTEFQANIKSTGVDVPKDWASRMHGTTPERLAKLIVKASQKCKPELILTFSGRLGIRLSNLSFWLGRKIRTVSLPIIEKMIKAGV